MGRIDDAQEILELTIKELDNFLDAHPQFEDARRILIEDYHLLAILLDKNGQNRFAEAAREKEQKLREQFQMDLERDPFDNQPLNNRPN